VGHSNRRIDVIDVFDRAPVRQPKRQKLPRKMRKEETVVHCEAADAEFEGCESRSGLENVAEGGELHARH